MDRRGFLRTTFIGGLAVGGGGCAVAGTRTSEVPLADDELERKLAKLDRAMARMQSREGRAWFLRKRERELDLPEAHAGLSADGQLVQASLRSALLVSTIAELPEANRSDPRVLERLERHSDEADFAVFGALAKLEALQPEELDELDRASADDPEFGKQVVAEIDELAGSFGVASSRRLHLRSMANHLQWRFERERFSAVLGDTLGKVQGMIEAAARQLGGQPAFAGGDPEWLARTQATLRMYEPAPTDAPPMAEPPPAEATAEPAAPLSEGERQELQTFREAEAARAQTEQQQHEAVRAEAEAELAKTKRKRDIFLGVGVGLAVLGGLGLGIGLATSLGLWIAGAVVLTAAVILLILAIVVAVRVGKQRKALEAMG